MNITRHSLFIYRSAVRPGQVYSIWQSTRLQSSLISKHPDTSTIKNQEQQHSHLHRISTINLIRNILLGKIFTSPFLFKHGMTCLSAIANSNSALLDPDKNILLKAIIKPLIYNHFCAGTNKTEIKKTLDYLKKTMGFKGVILIYSREIPAMPAEKLEELEALDHDKDIEIWRDGNLKTLEMVEKGDYVGIKFTGAGPRVAKALLRNHDPPPQLLDALTSICNLASSRKSRIWIDAEQQIYQPTIDRWTTNLMVQHNKSSALVSLTVQAYLKSAPATITTLLEQAAKKNFVLGVKLVRGAYISSETRTLIHDTKTQTDDCYDNIAAGLIKNSWPGVDSNIDFPHVELFLAGHNEVSIRKACLLHNSLVQQQQQQQIDNHPPCPPIKFGQLLGMADNISCELLAMTEKATATTKGEEEEKAAPPPPPPIMVYKCMNWGTVKEFMHYLTRRATENKSAMERMTSTVQVMQKEFKRRVLGFVFGR